MEEGRFKILTVGDGQDDLLILKALVGELSPEAEILSAMNGREGIALAEAEIPDVILLDISVPGLDGIEVCRKLKMNRVLKETPVIFVTADQADKKLRILALETGAEAFLTLPADKYELKAQIRAIHEARFAGLQKQAAKACLPALVRDETAQLNIAYRELPLQPDQRDADDSPGVKRPHDSEGKYRLIAESVHDVIWVYNADQRKLTYVSPSVFTLRGITVEEALQESAEQTMPPASYETLKESIDASINELKRDPGGSSAALYEVQRPCGDGTFIWTEDSVISRYNAAGEIEVYGVSRNINERKAQEDKLRYIGFHDQLTGLYNRRFFEEEMRRLDTQRNHPISLVMGDINGLKLVNDSLGHATGDKLLQKAAQILRKACRADDIIARLGGDEFVILLPKTNALRATQIISRIKDLMAEEKFADIEVTISFGLDTKESDQQHMPEVLTNAENHMYRNKLYERSNMQNKTVDIIMNMLFKKSAWELMHSKRVSEICRAIATMMGLNKDFVKQIEIAGLLHDIGKIGIDEEILNKAGKLTDDEWLEIVKHSEMGWWILKSTGEFPDLAGIILEHHEKWDGSGYPKGLKGEGISKEARIISVADAYDTMTCKRIYRDGISHTEAVEEIKKRSGTQFDPGVVDVLLHCIMKTGSKYQANEQCPLNSL